MRRDVSATAVKLLITGRNRSWTSQTSRAAWEGTSLPKLGPPLAAEDILVPGKIILQHRNSSKINN